MELKKDSFHAVRSCKVGYTKILAVKGTLEMASNSSGCIEMVLLISGEAAISIFRYIRLYKIFILCWFM